MKPYAVQSFRSDRGEVAECRVLKPGVESLQTEEITGTELTLTPKPGVLYRCGELRSPDVSSFPAAGRLVIWFTSGAAPTATVGIANFAAEANKRYRITVEDGYATYDAWPVGGGE